MAAAEQATGGKQRSPSLSIGRARAATRSRRTYQRRSSSPGCRAAQPPPTFVARNCYRTALDTCRSSWIRLRQGGADNPHGGHASGCGRLCIAPPGVSLRRRPVPAGSRNRPRSLDAKLGFVVREIGKSIDGYPVESCNASRGASRAIGPYNEPLAPICLRSRSNSPLAPTTAQPCGRNGETLDETGQPCPCGSVASLHR